MAGGHGGAVSGFRGFGRDARRMVIAGLINFLGFGLLGFALVLYLRVLGYSSVLYGTLALIMEVSNVAVLLFSGLLADRVGRKRMLVLSAVLSTAGYLIISVFDTMPFFMASAVLVGVSGGFWGPAFNALLTVKTHPRRRRYLFSLNSIVGNLGSGFITLVGGFIPVLFMDRFGFDVAPAYRMIFVLAFLLTLSSVFLLLRLRPDRLMRPVGGRGGGAGKKPWGLILKFSLPGALVGVGAGILVPYFPLYFDLRFDLQIDRIGMLFALLSFVMASMTLFLPRMSERRGTVLISTMFHTVALVAMISMPFTPWLSVVVLLFILRAALFNVPNPIMTSFMMGLMPRHARATANSATQFSWMVTHAAGVFIGGFIWNTGDLVLPFYITTCLYTVSTVLYLAFFLRMDDGASGHGPVLPRLRNWLRRW